MTLNANGIRAAARRGFFEWFLQQDVDVLCLQETKAQEAQLSDDVFFPKGYHRFFCDAKKPGYSGVAIYSRYPPLSVHKGLGWPCADDEGRYLQLDFPGLSIASLYLPSGSSGDLRQRYKFEFMENYAHVLRRHLQENRQFIVCGDWNIVHRAIDIKNFQANQKNSGCLPEERAWLDQVFSEGWVDAFRVLNQSTEQYTWWSARGRARAHNVGWRIDYQVVSPGLRDKLKKVEINPSPIFSDHAPFRVLYDVTLSA